MPQKPTQPMKQMNHKITQLVLLSLMLQWPLLRAEQTEDFGRVIDAIRHHLGDSDTPGWKDTKRKPEGFELKVVFEAKSNPKPLMLSFLQRHVQDSWKLILNDKEVGSLPLKEPAVWTKISIPANALKDGPNTLAVSVVTADSKDDIVIGPFHLNDVSFKEWARFGRINIQVLDSKTEQPIPARITVTNMSGQKV